MLITSALCCSIDFAGWNSAWTARTVSLSGNHFAEVTILFYHANLVIFSLLGRDEKENRYFNISYSLGIPKDGSFVQPLSVGVKVKPKICTVLPLLSFTEFLSQKWGFQWTIVICNLFTLYSYEVVHQLSLPQPWTSLAVLAWYEDTWYILHEGQCKPNYKTRNYLIQNMEDQKIYSRTCPPMALIIS